MSYDWAWYVVPRALPVLLQGLQLTITITLVVIALGFFLGILVAAGRLARSPLINKPIAAYIEFFRGTPALVQLVWIYYCLPIILGIEMPSFASIVVALTLNVGAFYGEAIRAGIQAVRLAEHGVKLLPGTNYHWFVSLVLDPERRSKDFTVGAWIARREPDAASQHCGTRRGLSDPDRRPACGASRVVSDT